MSNKAENTKIIKRAFANFVFSQERIVKAGMISLLDDAVIYALQSHDENHPDHLRFGDTYGWMLFHNGLVVESKVNSNDQMAGTVTKQLMRLKGNAPKSGWFGIVMAGMDPPTYYSVDYETDILNETINMTKQKFLQYFKPIK